MTPTFAESFTAPVADGDTITLELDGFTLTATIHNDDDASPPWENEDGHGPVSGWRRKDSKRPGELILSADDQGQFARFYDFAEACRIARRDGWGCKGGRLDGETARQYAARAARSDFEYLRGWCKDEWHWIGVAVTVSRKGVNLTKPWAHALWGIDSPSADHITQTANELAEQALEAARAKLSEIAA